MFVAPKAVILHAFVLHHCANALSFHLAGESPRRSVHDAIPQCLPEIIYEMIGGQNRSRNTCQHPIFGPQQQNGWSNRLLVVPELKFAMCYIEKNACTQFNTLINSLNGIFASGRSIFLQSSYMKMDVPVETISRENGWRKAVFLRDPLERFLSAYLSKCVTWEDSGLNCLGGHRATESNAMERFEQMVMTDLTEYQRYRKYFGGTYNAHYDPQSSFCDGADISTYDYVGFLSNNASSVHDQVGEMLTNVAKVPSWRLDEVMSSVEELFPRDGVAGHFTNSTHQVSAFYRNPEVLSATRDFFSADYKALSSAFANASISLE